MRTRQAWVPVSTVVLFSASCSRADCSTLPPQDQPSAMLVVYRLRLRNPVGRVQPASVQLELSLPLSKSWGYTRRGHQFGYVVQDFGKKVPPCNPSTESTRASIPDHEVRLQEFSFESNLPYSPQPQTCQKLPPRTYTTTIPSRHSSLASKQTTLPRMAGTNTLSPDPRKRGMLKKKPRMSLSILTKGPERP